jgi:hypothetical protein
MEDSERKQKADPAVSSTDFFRRLLVAGNLMVQKG